MGTHHPEERYRPTFCEATSDPQALANDYVVPFDHPTQGRVNLPGFPVDFIACRAGTRSAAPTLGQHTDEILRRSLSITFEVQHWLGSMEPLLRGFVVVPLSGPGVELLRDPVAVPLRDVRHALPLR